MAGAESLSQMDTGRKALIVIVLAVLAFGVYVALARPAWAHAVYGEDVYVVRCATPGQSFDEGANVTCQTDADCTAPVVEAFCGGNRVSNLNRCGGLHCGLGVCRQSLPSTRGPACVRGAY